MFFPMFFRVPFPGALAPTFVISCWLVRLLEAQAFEGNCRGTFNRGRVVHIPLES